jgi:hypothetical protein
VADPRHPPALARALFLARALPLTVAGPRATDPPPDPYAGPSPDPRTPYTPPKGNSLEHARSDHVVRRFPPER